MSEAASDVAPDGRRARRLRNRAAVIDAMFELMVEGHLPPGVEDVAARAGVSVSSVFRYFENLDDLLQETIERYFQRFAPRFEVPPVPGGTVDDRVAALVDARLDLYEAIAPIARMARVRAPDQARIAETLAATRRGFADQIRLHFAPDLDPRSQSDAGDRLALIDACTSFESWDLLQGTHGLDRSRIRRAWVLGLGELLGVR